MITETEIPFFTYPSGKQHNMVLVKLKQTQSQTEDRYKLAKPLQRVICNCS